MGARQHAIQQILLVDDDLSLAMTLRQRLAGPGRNTTWVTRAIDARALPSCYEIGILNTHLVDGCGIALAQELIASGTIANALFFTDTKLPHVLDLAQSVGECLTRSMGVESVIRRVNERLAATCAADAADDEVPPSSGRHPTSRRSTRY
jgi:DNA-binding response OmpR family regulator